MNKQDLDRNMNVVTTIKRAIPGFFNPISGEQDEEAIVTYILEFKDTDEAEEFDEEIENWDEDEGPGNIEHYLNYRIVQIIPFIDVEEDNEVLAENKAILVQNAALNSLATIEIRKAFMWIFNHISSSKK